MLKKNTELGRGHPIRIFKWKCESDSIPIRFTMFSRM